MDNLSKLYSLRSEYTIIALTGRTGSGCTTISKQMIDGFKVDHKIYPLPSSIDKSKNPNAFKKYKIAYDYSIDNYDKFVRVNYLDVLVLFILKYPISLFFKFLKSKELLELMNSEINEINTSNGRNLRMNINRIRFHKVTKQYIKKLSVELKRKNKIDFSKLDQKQYLQKLNTLFYSKDYQDFISNILSLIVTKHTYENYKVFQIFSSNIRKSGNPYDFATNETSNIFTIAEMLNCVVKSINEPNKLFRKKGLKANTKIVIDSMRNPHEIMFFKQKFSAFYLIAVNRANSDRDLKLKLKFKWEFEFIEKHLEKEYTGGKNSEYHNLYIRECIERADIHLTYMNFEEATILNETLQAYTSPFLSWGMQLIKFISLIEHPGLITPSPEERCMQLAYNAKYNSGCISRQVGASITDEFFSIKAIGWNNTPEGQVPCNLRSVEEYFELTDKRSVDSESEIFTPYELKNKEFKSRIDTYYKIQIESSREKLNGRNVCFCFKSIINSYTDGKNQVHTRSLHAEESAFLQITKYGGTGVKNGKLFTTASPCELCAKKAYQLGISSIFYIDPYPGISLDQIIQAGNIEKQPKLVLFNGAIGNAYHNLYEPFMPYKDELKLILGHQINDLATTLKTENEKLKSENKRLQNELKKT